jgi:hypothetical protein
MSKGATNAGNKGNVQGQKYAATPAASRKYEGSRIGNAVHRNNYAAHPLSKVGNFFGLSSSSEGERTQRQEDKEREGERRNGTEMKKDTHIGLAEASRASLSLLRIFPVDPSRRWCLPLAVAAAAAAVIGTVMVGTAGVVAFKEPDRPLVVGASAVAPTAAVSSAELSSGLAVVEMTAASAAARLSERRLVIASDCWNNAASAFGHSYVAVRVGMGSQAEHPRTTMFVGKITHR